MRYEHWLKSGGRPSYPQRIIIVECEGWFEPAEWDSNTEIERLVSWHIATLRGEKGCYGKVKSWAGFDCQSFWTAILPWMSARGLTLLCSWRAMRNATLLNFFQHVETGQLTWSGTDFRASGESGQQTAKLSSINAVMEDPPTCLGFTVPKSKAATLWIDSRNFGIDRDRLPDDYSAWTAELANGVKRLIGVIKERELGGWKNTAGSMAMASWKFKHLKHSVLAHCNKPALELERQAYYGGRCECFRIGSFNGPIYHLDVKSMYPYVAMRSLVPARLIGHWPSPMQARSYMDMTRDLCIADVTIQTDEPNYPLRREGSTIWPVGRFRTQLCGPELYHAMQCQSVVAWHGIAAYEGEPLLASFMADWYSARVKAGEENDWIVESAIKRILNCLPGKLGQREIAWTDAPLVQPWQPWDSWYTEDHDGNPVRYRSLDWHVQREVVNGFAADSVPAVAAWITSAGRQYLADLLAIAGRDHAYYCDTDSLFCDDSGYRRLCAAGMVRTDTLGFLRIKGVHQSVDILGVKYYAADGELTCSGKPDSDVFGCTTGIGGHRVIGYKSQLERQERPIVAIRLAGYHRSEGYKLGSVGGDGTVSPFVIRS